MVLIFTSNTNQSAAVIKELEIAVENDTIIIPFRVEDVVPNTKLSFYISSTQWHDALTPPLEAHIHSLAENIGKILDIEITPTTNVYNLQKTKETDIYHKIKVPSLNPLITMAVGIIIFNVFDLAYNENLIGINLVILGLIFSGFIVSYFSKEKKIIYGLYMGICAAIITLILQLLIDPKNSHLSVSGIIISLTIFVVLTVIGSLIGKKTSTYILKKQSD
jgi:hypothetical protein